MRFRLIYDGELRANQRDPRAGQKDRLAEHKQNIRKIFHKQMRYMWEKNWLLSNHRVFPKDYGIDRVADGVARWGTPNDQRVPLAEAVAEKHAAYNYRFVPLVRQEWKLTCSLKILFLRHDPPGSVIQAGDLDNRIKTLIDALRLPANANELAGNEMPGEGECPIYGLLEDDNLITDISVESDQLLFPPNEDFQNAEKRVNLVITVEIRPYEVTMFNINFA